MRSLKITACLLFSFIIKTALANSVIIPMYLTASNGPGKFIGNIIATDTKKGLLLIPDLRNLTPGSHGFHVHLNASCDKSGMAAGDHLDPKATGKHLGPYSNQGHLGDLPILVVNANGTATLPVLAPRLTTAMLQNHAIMIHEHGDNYSDVPEKLGGGGARIACGVVPSGK